jgi:purine-binding chemotaxis protein CheW
MAQDKDILLPGHDEDTLKGKYLIFSMGSEMYGIEIRFITEILGMQPITSVPEMPGYIKGITNLRGKIIPVMDARMRFGKELREYDDRTCIIVIDTNITTTGLIVDRVLEVVSMSEEDIAPPLDIGGSGSRFIKGFGKSDGNVKLLIDCTKLLAGEFPAL